MEEEVGGHGAHQRLAGHQDGLPRGLEGGAPSCPLTGRIRGGGGEVKGLLLHGLPRSAAIGLVPSRSHGLAIAREGAASHHLPLRSRCPIDRLACIMRLGEPRAIEPTDTITDLPPRIFNGNGHAVKGSSATKGKEVGSGLGNPQGLTPKGRAGHSPIPLLAHEAPPAGGILQEGGGAAGQPVGWIGHNGIHRGLIHGGHALPAISKVESVAAHGSPRSLMMSAVT